MKNEPQNTQTIIRKGEEKGPAVIPTPNFKPTSF